MNILRNGLTLLQQNPLCAAQLDPQNRAYGWLYTKGACGQWITMRKLSQDEIDIAHEQEVDGVVLQGTTARVG